MIRKSADLKLLGLILAILIVFPPVSARDFEYTYKGQTLAYSILDEWDVCITKNGDFDSNWNLVAPGNVVTGDLEIPATVVDPETEKEYSVYGIGNGSFYQDSLKSVKFPSTIAFIGRLAFSNCVNLTRIYINGNLEYIDTGAFESCVNLKSVDISSPLRFLGGMTFSNCENLESVILPNSVREIGGGAFYQCAKLSSIELPDSLRRIGSETFSLCTSLSSVVVPDSVHDIGNKAFAFCSNLRSVVLPKALTKISSELMRECTSLKAITIPDSVKIIEIEAFSGCTGLESVFMSDSVEEIEVGAFALCRGLKSIRLSAKISVISDSLFLGCWSLKTISIPNRVTKIGYWAFYDCAGLESIDISGLVEYIGYAAFAFENDYFYKPLLEVNYNTITPIRVDNRLFNQIRFETATLYVAPGGLQAARKTAPWSYFMNIQEKVFSGIEDIKSEIDTDAPIEVYNLNGVKIGEDTEGLPSGIYIVRQGLKVTKIAVK